MAKKTPRPGSTTKEFSNSPFKDLKGLSALQPPASVPQERVASPEANPASHERAQETAVSFAEEMDFLGVKPLPGHSGGEAVVETASPTIPPEPPARVSDEDLFLNAVGTMETVFKDAWAEDEEVKQASPRRMRQLTRGHLRPEAQLDLHGLTAEEARVRVGHFLQNAVVQGHKVVLVITGKGLHSEEGPVLKQTLEQLLRRPQPALLEWGAAPKQYGGDGAYVIFLRDRKMV